MKDYKLNIWACAITFFVGVVMTLAVKVWLWTDLSKFELKFELNLFELISLAVTIWLAFFIKVVLDKNSENSNKISALIFDKIQSIIIELDRVKNKLQVDDEIVMQDANSIQKRLNTLHVNIETLLRKEIRRFEPSEIQAFGSDFKEHTRDIKDLMTNTPISQTGQSVDIYVAGANYKYSQHRVGEIIQEVQKLDSLLVNLQYAVLVS